MEGRVFASESVGGLGFRGLGVWSLEFGLAGLVVINFLRVSCVGSLCLVCSSRVDNHMSLQHQVQQLVYPKPRCLIPRSFGPSYGVGSTISKYSVLLDQNQAFTLEPLYSL